MRPKDFDIKKVIDELQGTCNSLDSALPYGMEWEDLTEDDHAEIDNEIFLCESCGWWCEISECEGDELVCEDCSD